MERTVPGTRSRRDSEEQKTRSAGSEVTDLRRVNVNFSAEAYDALLKLAEMKGTTMSAVLREAIALEQWLIDTQRSGGRLLVERGDEVREVVKL